MTAQIVNVKDWVGKPLTKFKIIEMTEVYITYEEGDRFQSIGYFKNPTIAQAFADQQDDPERHRVMTRYVLTNGTIGFPLTEDEVNLMSDEDETVKIRKRAIANLSEPERAILGFST